MNTLHEQFETVKNFWVQDRPHEALLADGDALVRIKMPTRSALEAYVAHLVYDIGMRRIG